MYKYINYIKENKSEDVYVERLKYLVDILDVLMKDAKKMYPEVKGYKRTTRITNELMEALNKTFKYESESESNIKINTEYIYKPDSNTRPEYKDLSGKLAKVTRILKNERPNPHFCDSNDISNCIYNIGFKIFGGTRHFYTRAHCLVDKDKYEKTKSPGVSVEEKTKIKENNYYIYNPDLKTYNNYLSYRNKRVFVIRIVSRGDMHSNCDSPYWDKCRYLVSLPSTNQFWWTRKECLK